MQVTGIICEYNPLHLGHKKQLDLIRRVTGPDSGIVCLMSGNFVQRGAPAIVDKSARARAAVLCGADLVLELPVTAALSSAEGFAAQGVQILSPFCDLLCFGAETADTQALLSTAQALLSPGFPDALHSQLDKGLSFPAARQAALESMGLDSTLLTKPNNILAVEYCKAILSQNATLEILPIPRGGNYHDALPDAENPSATSVRQRMLCGEEWQSYVPQEAKACLAQAPLHSMDAGERATLALLRSMPDDGFEALPYGSEGLWRKFMHACWEKATVEEILTAVKSKRYTHTRLCRMLMCAVLGITAKDLASPAPYVRVLAFNDRGRRILRCARSTGLFLNAGEVSDLPYQAIENRCGDLYGLFRTDTPAPPDAERQRRVVYLDKA